MCIYEIHMRKSSQNTYTAQWFLQAGHSRNCPWPGNRTVTAGQSLLHCPLRPSHSPLPKATVWLVGNHFFSFLDSCILWVEIPKHNSLVLSIFCFCMNSVSHGVCVHYKHFCCVCNRKWDFCICLSLALADNERDEYTYIHQSGLRAMMESVVLARIWRSKNAYVQLVRYPSQYLIFSSFFTWAILVCVSLIYLICSH